MRKLFLYFLLTGISLLSFAETPDNLGFTNRIQIQLEQDLPSVCQTKSDESQRIRLINLARLLDRRIEIQEDFINSQKKNVKNSEGVRDLSTNLFLAGSAALGGSTVGGMGFVAGLMASAGLGLAATEVPKAKNRDGILVADIFAEEGLLRIQTISAKQFKKVTKNTKDVWPLIDSIRAELDNAKIVAWNQYLEIPAVKDVQEQGIGANKVKNMLSFGQHAVSYNTAVLSEAISTLNFMRLERELIISGAERLRQLCWEERSNPNFPSKISGESLSEPSAH